MRRLSVTGFIFTTLFLALSGWCVASTLLHGTEATTFIAYVTMPFSIPILWLATLGGSLNVGLVNWLLTTLLIVLGCLEFYFWGWLLERPFRR